MRISKMNIATIADFVRNFGRYHDEARIEPVVLTKHGRPSVVLISIELFEELTGQGDPRLVFGAGEMPEEMADEFVEQLDADEAKAGGGDND